MEKVKAAGCQAGLEGLGVSVSWRDDAKIPPCSVIVRETSAALLNPNGFVLNVVLSSR